MDAQNDKTVMMQKRIEQLEHQLEQGRSERWLRRTQTNTLLH